MLRVSAFSLRAGAASVSASSLIRLPVHRFVKSQPYLFKSALHPLASRVAKFSSGPGNAAAKQFVPKSQQSDAEETVEDFEAFLKGEKSMVKPLFDPATEGIVVSSEKGVILIDGLEKAPVGAEIALESGHRALVLSLLAGSVEAAVLDGKMSVPIETRARISSPEPSVPVGRQLIGRVITRKMKRRLYL